MGLLTKIFGTQNDRQIKKLEVMADKVEALADKYLQMTDKELFTCTEQFKEMLQQGSTLDDILPEAFACVREASTRVLGMRHFYVQIIGGIALHQGRIAEMSTGEGKTLVATLPAYLNALSGKGVHIVTVNEYLAKRDAEWMGQIFKFLGLSVGVIYNQQSFEDKRAAYRCDITYGTNSAFGFDYLRDNQARSVYGLVQRELNFVIIDEVDSVLIDEARTPLIISGGTTKSSETFYKTNGFAKTLRAPNPEAATEEDQKGDFEINEEDKKITLTERGMHKAEAYFRIENIGDYNNLELYRNIRLAIRATFLMKRDRDYVVKDNQIIIVDEFTGRLMVGRRFNDGLHTAIEAKENIKIKDENKITATITYQNLFRLYKKLSGMTGTAKTEEEEFRNIYSLDIVVIPTNKPVIRRDENDKLYTTVKGKLNAIIEDIKDCNKRGQPVLVGTVSVEKSEQLSAMLVRERIMHNVLNAKNHEKEAEIVAQAGKKGAVTIATNMAGRGTDIMLGGNPDFLARQFLVRARYSEAVIADATSRAKDVSADAVKAREVYQEKLAEFKQQTDIDKAEVIALGGLRIIGTERHESRRIDNQLRGRAGRQGDAGSSCFYISMEDDLMRIFGGDRVKNIAISLNLPEDMPISIKMITNKVEDAQKRLEGRNYAMRKQVLSFDDVINRQRTIIYSDRRKMLFDKSIYSDSIDILSNRIKEVLAESIDFNVDYRRANYKVINRRLLAGLFLNEDIKELEGTELLCKEDFENLDLDKLAEAVSKRLIRVFKKLLFDYKELCNPLNLLVPINVALDFSLPAAERNYSKLNKLIQTRYKAFDGIELLSPEEGIELDKHSADAKAISEFIADKFEHYYSDKLSEYNQRILAGFVQSALRSCKTKDCASFNNALSLLSPKYKVTLSESDCKPTADTLVTVVTEQIEKELAKQDLAFSGKLAKAFAKAFATTLPASPQEWSFKKVDRDFISELFPTDSNGDLPIKDIITCDNLNRYTVRKLGEMVCQRIHDIYLEKLQDNGEAAFEALKGNFESVNQYITALIASRIKTDEDSQKWDFQRICEILAYNCLPRNSEDKTHSLLCKEDLSCITAEGFLEDAVNAALAQYLVITESLRSKSSLSYIRTVLSKLLGNRRDGLSAIDKELRAALLPKIGMESKQNDSQKKGSDSQRTDNKDKFAGRYEMLSLPLVTNEDKSDGLEYVLQSRLLQRHELFAQKCNYHILRSLLQLLLSDSNKEGKANNDELCALFDAHESFVTKDGIALATDEVCARCIDYFDRKRATVKEHASFENILTVIKPVIEGADITAADKTLCGYFSAESVLSDDSLQEAALKNAISTATASTLKQYKSGLKGSALRDLKLNSIMYSCIQSVVTNKVTELSALPYPEWKYSAVNAQLSEALLPIDAPSELSARLFTPADIALNLLDGLSSKVEEKVRPLYEELIQAGAKAEYTSPHSHILKMLPPVVANVVMDYIDYSDDYNTWDYAYINQSLAEKLLPNGLDDKEADTLVTKQDAAKQNIDDVIDAVIERVERAYNRKCVEYNLSILEGYITDLVKRCINRRELYTAWNYDAINSFLASKLIAAVDGDKKIITPQSVAAFINDSDLASAEEESVQEDSEDSLDEDVADSLLETADRPGVERLSYSVITEAVMAGVAEIYSQRIDLYNRLTEMLCRKLCIRAVMFSTFEKLTMLKYTDERWYDHIDNMERLRAGIGLRALGQQNPITCYQSEGFELFNEMVGLVKEDVVFHSLKDSPEDLLGKKEDNPADRFNKKSNQKVYYKRSGAKPIRRSNKIGPNEPCPCGSGKKYKKCCMNKGTKGFNWNEYASDGDDSDE